MNRRRIVQLPLVLAAWRMMPAAHADAEKAAHDGLRPIYHEITPPWPGDLTRVGPRHVLIDVVDGVLVNAVWSESRRRREGARFEPGVFDGGDWAFETDGPALSPQRIATRRYPEQASFDLRRRALRMLSLVDCGRELLAGETITLRSSRGGILSLTIGDAARSAAIHTPHHGWTPGSRDKHALVGLWCGPDGATDGWLSESVRFGVVDAETGRFLQGWDLSAGHRLIRSRRATEIFEYGVEKNRWSTGFDTYEARFAELREPGRYRVLVEGLGVSYPFVIDRDVHKHLVRHLARGLIYIQHDDDARAEVVPARLAMPPTLRHMRFIPTSRTYASISPDGIGDKGKLWSRPTPRETDPQLAHFDIDHPTEGVRDAADYDIRPQHLAVAAEMLALSLALPRIEALAIGRSESGRAYDKIIRGRRIKGAVAISDVFHTALYCGDAWTRMQIDTDGPWRGAVRGGFDMVGYIGWKPDFQSWALSFNPEYHVHLMRPDPWATFAYAGFAAMAAIKFDIVGDVGMRAVYESRAREAWGWALAHEDLHDGDGWNPAWRTHGAFRSAKAIAAVSLWGLSGEAGFHDAWESVPGHAVARSGGVAARIYLILDLVGYRAARPAKRAAIHADAYQMGFMRILARKGPAAVAFGRPLGPDGDGEWRSTLNLPYAVHRDYLGLFLAAAHPAQKRFDAAARARIRQWIEAEVSYTTGRSPMGRGFVTGFGYDPPRSIQFTDWTGMGLASPPPGLIAFGVVSNRMLRDGAEQDGYEPTMSRTPYPLRVAFGDGVHPTVSEFAFLGTLWPTLVAAIMADTVGADD